MFASALASLLVPVALTATTTLDAVAQDPPIRVSLNQDGHYVRGDDARVEVRADRDGYLLVLHADPEGRVRVLLPIDPDDDNFVRAGKTYELRGRGDRDAFYVEHSNGTGLVYAALSIDPFRISDFVVGDHWDYRSLRVSDVASDAELELTEIVGRMGSSASFDYDVAYYEIHEPVAYAYPSAFYPSSSYWDPYYSCYYCGSRYHGPGLRIHIGFGSAYYYPWYYDRWYYGPSVYYGDYYPYYGYRWPYYGYRNTYYRPYTRYYRPYAQNPYRFKGVRPPRDRDRRAVEPRDRNRTRSRLTTNLVDYRRRGVDLLNEPRTAANRTRDARVRTVAPNDRRSETRRATGDQGRRAAPQRTRPTKAEPRRAEPRRAAPQRRPTKAEPRTAEPRKATPRRATPQRATPRRAEPRRATPQRSAPSRAEPRRSTPSRAAPRRSTSSGRRVTQAERRTSEWWKTTDRASPGRRVATSRRSEVRAPSRSASRPRASAPSRASRPSQDRKATRSSDSRRRVSSPSRASRQSPSRSASRPSVSRRAPSASRAPSSRGSSSRGSVSRGGSSRGGSSARSGGYRRR